MNHAPAAAHHRRQQQRVPGVQPAAHGRDPQRQPGQYRHPRAEPRHEPRRHRRVEHNAASCAGRSIRRSLRGHRTAGPAASTPTSTAIGTFTRKTARHPARSTSAADNRPGGHRAPADRRPGGDSTGPRGGLRTEPGDHRHQGLGVALLPGFAVAGALEAGTLVSLDFPAPALSLRLVWRGDREDDPGLRAAAEPGD